MSEFSYSATGLPAGLSIDANTGAITGTPTTVGAFNCTITATAPTGSASITWAPGVANAGYYLSAPSATSFFVNGVAPAPRGAAFRVAYALEIYGTTDNLVAPFTFDATLGAIPSWLSGAVDTGTGLLSFSGTPTTLGSYTFAPRVTDSTTPTPNVLYGAQVTIQVTPNPMTLNGGLSVSAEQGEPWSSTMTLGGYFVAPVTISASSGTIPSWMSTSVSGNTVTFSGTPPATGTFTFTPQATDSSTPTPQVADDGVQSVTVGYHPMTLSGTLTNGTTGTAYSSTMTLGGYFVAPVTISASSGTIPSWMSTSVSGNTVTFSGTPPATGTFTFTPQATDRTPGTARTAVGGAQSVVVAAPLVSWAVYATPFVAEVGAYNGATLFIAVGGSPGSAAVSTDLGATWTTVNSFPSGIWNLCAYGAGLFVLIPDSGTSYATSPDGTTWTTRTLPYNAQGWGALAYINNQFVLLASFSSAGYSTDLGYTSPDGISWTQRTLADLSNWSGVAYGNSLYAAVAISGYAGVDTSPDAATWTRAATGAFWNDVSFMSGVFVAASSTQCATSTNGATWSAPVTLPTTDGWAYGAAANNVMVRAGSSSTVIESADGVSWTAATLPSDSTNGHPGGGGRVFAGGNRIFVLGGWPNISVGTT